MTMTGTTESELAYFHKLAVSGTGLTRHLAEIEERCGTTCEPHVELNEAINAAPEDKKAARRKARDSDTSGLLRLLPGSPVRCRNC